MLEEHIRLVLIINSYPSDTRWQITIAIGYREKIAVATVIYNVHPICIRDGKKEIKIRWSTS